MHVADLPTPALLIDADAFEHNVATMAQSRPGSALRPHMKAVKSTDLARELVAAGHEHFCCATIGEMEGMVAAGIGDDLLLANEVLDARRLGRLVSDNVRITVAVDSEETIDAAAAGGVRDVLIDLNIGLPRCGCEPNEAPRLAELAQSAGLEVRGVMGYEGHIMGNPDRAARAVEVQRATDLLLEAHAAIGGPIISGGGTGTWDLNTAVTELQAGSYTLMDTAYAELGLPFREALSVLGSVISLGRSNDRGYAVIDAGLKTLGMDHGNPLVDGTSVWFVSDEHTTLADRDRFTIGDRVRLRPAHVDPTMAKHREALVVRNDEVIDTWRIDLRHW